MARQHAVDGVARARRGRQERPEPEVPRRERDPAATPSPREVSVTASGVRRSRAQTATIGRAHQ